MRSRGANLGAVKLFESVRARLRAVDPFRVDIALAALFAVAGTIEMSNID
jgi:hypothetical protein